jgi:hypothetical protein
MVTKEIMRPVLGFTMIVFLASASAAHGYSTCTSVLTADQLDDLHAMIFPGHPFDPHLTDDGEPLQGPVRRLSRKDVDTMRDAILHPYQGVVGVANDELVAALNTWLRANPSGQLPAWDTRAGDDLSPLAWVPREWAGRTAEGYVELLKAGGNAGPLKPSTVAAPTTKGRDIGITQFVARDQSGRDQFLWTYIYRATIDGRLLTTLLAVCQADVVVMSPDEIALREMEQQLSTAWPTRDRRTVERILAPEWTVTMPDGTAVARAALLSATFDGDGRIVENMTTNNDSVRITLFDNAAVARGRTTMTVAVGGMRQTTSVQFTDFFVKREGMWQLTASHQTTIQ